MEKTENMTVPQNMKDLNQKYDKIIDELKEDII